MWDWTGATIEGGKSLAKFNGIFSAPPSMSYLFDAVEGFSTGKVLSGGGLTVIFTLFFIDFFDTAGTLTSVANVSGKIKGNKVEDIDKAMLADSAGTVAGAFHGDNNCNKLCRVWCRSKSWWKNWNDFISNWSFISSCVLVLRL